MTLAGMRPAVSPCAASFEPAGTMSSRGRGRDRDPVTSGARGIAARWLNSRRTARTEICRVIDCAK